MARSQAKILIVDDDEEILKIYQAVLSPHYQVTAVQDWLEGTNLLLTKSFDLLILDLRMSFFDAAEFIKKLRANHHPISILVCSAYPKLRERVADLQVDAILDKPFRLDDLERIVSELVAASKKRRKP